MGNARWTGIPLKSVLDSTPDFRKVLDIEHALSPDPILAWAMNGDDLPFLNGYPLKLIVPGYFGTYWVKHLSEIEIIDHDFSGHDAYFMTNGYRLPDNDCVCVAPGTTPDKTRPISTLAVRSFITSVMAGAVLPAGRTVELKGIAFDGGAGIRTVDISIDGGRSWRAAALGEDLGRFSFREWRLPVSFAGKGAALLQVRATNSRGETQPVEATWNPAGYQRQVIESTPVVIA